MAHEVVSPVLVGQEGLNTARRVMKAMKRAGAGVNVSCGLHVTIGVGNSFSRFRRMSTVRQRRVLFNVAAAYKYFNRGFDSLVSQSRREGAPNWNSYTAIPRMDRVAGTWANPDISDDEILSAVRQGFGRGHVNVRKFWTHGLIEFRQHNGTLNGRKIQNWTNLLHQLLKWAINDNHVNHRRHFTDFSPDLDGLLQMVAPGRNLEAALRARAAEIEATGRNWHNETHHSNMLHHHAAAIQRAIVGRGQEVN